MAESGRDDPGSVTCDEGACDEGICEELACDGLPPGALCDRGGNADELEGDCVDGGWRKSFACDDPIDDDAPVGDEG